MKSLECKAFGRYGDNPQWGNMERYYSQLSRGGRSPLVMRVSRHGLQSKGGRYAPVASKRAVRLPPGGAEDPDTLLVWQLCGRVP